jgi:hypothetical protein
MSLEAIFQKSRSLRVLSHKGPFLRKIVGCASTQTWIPGIGKFRPGIVFGRVGKRQCLTIAVTLLPLNPSDLGEVVTLTSEICDIDF